MFCKMDIILLLISAFGLCISNAQAENVHMTTVFVLPIEPSMFNWTLNGNGDHFSYRPSLLNAPDLPPWIHYVYSNRHQSGFLYGVPPRDQPGVELQIVGLNRKTYETRTHVVHVNVIEKPDPSRFDVAMKIDNLNVEDLFDTARLNRLLDVFRKRLWRESSLDLHLTFLASAVYLGARRPLRPTEEEGVVLRVGSAHPFSVALLELQEEVRPLWRVGPSCPRDFKRTTVDRLFREEGFALDWCAFRLLEEDWDRADDPTSQPSPSSPRRPAASVGVANSKGGNGQAWNGIMNVGDEGFGFREERDEDVWMVVPSKQGVPQRSYAKEFIFSILVPTLALLVLVVILSLLLCFHHEGISKRLDETPAVQMVQYEAVHRATRTLRSLSSNRASPSPSLASSMTLPLSSSPRQTMERGLLHHPNPPPYNSSTVGRT
ncbi:epsilon-sarcoglycan isoform X2 [Ischnura elegans]|uniref:epsilon-sarcoglycan isoform X2 n=1 Tax=Ischnura elegans TaxID=197161 RepID=UPI001ED8A578|nr:epsilon-sarcoglycan isoform X2 [Ischnura elegans]